MYKEAKLTREEKRKIKEYFVPYIENILVSNTIPKKIKVDTGQSIDTIYIFGNLPNNRILIYHLGTLEAIKGWYDGGIPNGDGTIYQANKLQKLIRSSFNATEHDLVIRARQLIKEGKRRKIY